MKITKKRARRRVGQGFTEYVVLVGLIAIALIGAVKGFRGALGSAFEAAEKKVHDEVTQSISEAGGNGVKAGSSTPTY